MRPRHYCRGRGGCSSCSATPPPRFNEAPALLPGKRRRYQALSEDVLHASMRPRHYCRGRARPRINHHGQSLAKQFASGASLAGRQSQRNRILGRGPPAILLIHNVKDHPRALPGIPAPPECSQPCGKTPPTLGAQPHTITVRRSTVSKLLPSVDTRGFTSSAGPRSRNST